MNEKKILVFSHGSVIVLGFTFRAVVNFIFVYGAIYELEIGFSSTLPPPFWYLSIVYCILYMIYMYYI